MTGTEKSIICAALFRREPSRQGYNGRARTHRLGPPVQCPHDKKAYKKRHGRQAYQTFGQPQQPHDKIGDRRNDQPRGHKSLDVGMVGHKTIDKLPYGIGKKERRPDDTQLLVIQRAALDNRGLHHIQPGATYIIKTIPEGSGKETLQSQFSRQLRSFFVT